MFPGIKKPVGRPPSNSNSKQNEDLPQVSLPLDALIELVITVVYARYQSGGKCNTDIINAVCKGKILNREDKNKITRLVNELVSVLPRDTILDSLDNSTGTLTIARAAHKLVGLPYKTYTHYEVRCLMLEILKENVGKDKGCAPMQEVSKMLNEQKKAQAVSLRPQEANYNLSNTSFGAIATEQGCNELKRKQDAKVSEDAAKVRRKNEKYAKNIQSQIARSRLKQKAIKYFLQNLSDDLRSNYCNIKKKEVDEHILAFDGKVKDENNKTIPIGTLRIKMKDLIITAIDNDEFDEELIDEEEMSESDEESTPESNDDEENDETNDNEQNDEER